MKLFAPKYYNGFTCISDRCTHSCCIGWEIDIDHTSAKRYASLSGGYGEIIKNSIEWEDTPHFRLSSDERCPHLDKNGLCRIILELGEDHLCDICREHPRFYNYSAKGKEVGLGLCCEEAARIILSSDDYDKLVEIGKTNEAEEDVEYDSTPAREWIFSVLSSDMEYREKLYAIYHEYDVSPSILTDAEWREIIASLEYLDEAHREMFACYSNGAVVPSSEEKATARALAYFVYRHCTEVYDDDDLRAYLGFCLFCERLLASLIAHNGTDDIVTLARIVSEEIEYSEDNTETIVMRFE